MHQIALIDYGMGNLHSMAKALEKVAPNSHIRITDEAETVRAADRVVFPGVGAMAACMQALQERDLIPAIQEAARNKPMLGVCLGMQALFDESEEGGGVAGLGLIPGRVRRFTFDEAARLKIPHMGWNEIQASGTHPLWSGIQTPWFYFVHSFYCQPDETAHGAAYCDYGQRFCAAVAHENLVAVQFHPEKSQTSGLRLLANFVAWNGESKHSPAA
ncbi:glutamine amidotransferase [Natronospira proteinivora]|uniref:Imidazole glycerol phosphate synthase subunit HisH n=1 Tax=Natronospira proteinivora TaxID=1807133 RepID=A0ABT1GAD1_9GAMM|nr:imidazole glycerol phosphate synthase subunit HisH [Natronospira proteinivora]MCP1728284.1 glutamine amidotransferase [Natronospira proteinivora]